MAFIGSFALLLAFALSVYCFGAGLLALLSPDEPNSERLSGNSAPRRRRRFWGSVSCRQSRWWCPLFVTISPSPTSFTTAIAISLLPTSSPHSGPDRKARFSSGACCSPAYAFVLRLRYKTDPRLFAYASVVVAGVQIFFLALVNFAANPFGLLEGPLRPDGSGLNPLLQYPEMVIHPPMLYMGYVGFTVPFAFALGALIMKYPGEKWIHITRRWTMVTWGFLTCGIFLGCALGLLGPGLGWLLGMGSRRKRLADALACRNRLPAFGHDAGKTRHAEGLEHVAGVRLVSGWRF